MFLMSYNKSNENSAYYLTYFIRVMSVVNSHNQVIIPLKQMESGIRYT